MAGKAETGARGRVHADHRAVHPASVPGAGQVLGPAHLPERVSADPETVLPKNQEQPDLAQKVNNHELGGCLTENGFIHMIHDRHTESVGTSTFDLKYSLHVFNMGFDTGEGEEIDAVLNAKDYKLKRVSVSNCLQQLLDVEEDLYCTMKKTRRIART
jgi:hypothetical protein